MDARQRQKPSELLTIFADKIKAIALSHNVTNIRVFGSTARHEDTIGSDLDLLVTPIRGKTTLMELARIETEIEQLIKIHVDVVLDCDVPLQYKLTIEKEAISL